MDNTYWVFEDNFWIGNLITNSRYIYKYIYILYTYYIYIYYHRMKNNLKYLAWEK